MAKVTSKFQVTIPKSLAEQFRLQPGDQIDWSASGDAIRITPSARPGEPSDSVEERLRLFDAATARQRRRQKKSPRAARGGDRGWRREELYRRGGSR